MVKKNMENNQSSPDKDYIPILGIKYENLLDVFNSVDGLFYKTVSDIKCYIDYL
ncbi:MAG: hypothetical protein LBC92_03780 [Rickettsiales bacterium]|jgi:hypothetical protein|nr:hypothetical protein [Rickettsiales bacterium]